MRWLQASSAGERLHQTPVLWYDPGNEHRASSIREPLHIIDGDVVIQDHHQEESYAKEIGEDR